MTSPSPLPGNRTSEAVEQWVKNMEAIKPRSMLPQQLAENMAIAQKYQRMEEALMIIANKGKVTRHYDDGETEKISLQTLAHEALSFDPLSQ